MSRPTTTCDADVLNRFLAEELTRDERSRLEVHLDKCEACRRRLERIAAGDDLWQQASQYLRDDPLDLPNRDADGNVSMDVGHATDEPTDGLPIVAAQRVLEWLAPSDDPGMLGRLGTYEIVGVIGAGGMGVVLKGFDRPLNRFVAIKVLAPHLASSGAARRRFAREAQAAAAVVHPHVVAIHAVFAEGELPYLVMPYLRGMSLQKRIQQNGPLSVPEILRIGAQTASGLAAAHAQGLVHRDIKPANILLEQGVERVAITDFGLARAIDDATTTRSGVIAGTPQYMSPEQARGESIDHRSDLFSLGSVLYAMCTGHAPFRAETTFGILRRITDHAPRSPHEINSDIPIWLSRLLERLLAKDPRVRFQSAEEVSELLERCLAHVQQPATVPLPVELRSARWSRRQRWAVGLMSFSLLIGTLFLSSGGSGLPRSFTSSREADADGRSPWPVVTDWLHEPHDATTDTPAGPDFAAATLDEGHGSPADGPYWGLTAAENLNELEQDLRRLEQDMDRPLPPNPADRRDD